MGFHYRVPVIKVYSSVSSCPLQNVSFSRGNNRPFLSVVICQRESFSSQLTYVKDVHTLHISIFYTYQVTPEYPDFRRLALYLLISILILLNVFDFLHESFAPFVNLSSRFLLMILIIHLPFMQFLFCRRSL